MRAVSTRPGGQAKKFGGRAIGGGRKVTAALAETAPSSAATTVQRLKGASATSVSPSSSSSSRGEKLRAYYSAPQSRGGREAATARSLSEAFEIGVQGTEVTVPVPIDYYKVLGLGSQRHASKDELERAFASRVASYAGGQANGVPFSDDAVEARRRVLDLARQALTSRSPMRRRVSGVSAGSGAAGGGGGGGIALRPTHESVAVPLSWVTGVLLLAVECGDFDNCVGIGTTLLEQSGGAFGSSASFRLRQKEKRDVSLAVALAHCELAKFYLESPQTSRGQKKRRVAEGCAHLNSALGMLKSAPGSAMMPVLCQEIEMTLERLVAPCALDHLRLPVGEEEHRETRLRAASVLRELLVEPQSSEDSAVNRSFLQAVMKALTVRETVQFLPWKALLESPEDLSPLPWFEPSTFYTAAVACLLAAYVDKEPKLVLRALALFEALEALEPSADLAAEFAVSMVLLGKLDDAIELLEEAESQGESRIGDLERMEAVGLDKGLPSKSSMLMTFIRFTGGSSGAAGAENGLLEGLCTFTEKWLELKAMPLFRDTNRQQNTNARLPPVCLIQYFDDPGVRRYVDSFENAWSLALATVTGKVSGAAQGLLQLLKKPRAAKSQQPQQKQEQQDASAGPTGDEGASSPPPQQQQDAQQYAAGASAGLGGAPEWIPGAKVLGTCAVLAVGMSWAVSRGTGGGGGGGQGTTPAAAPVQETQQVVRVSTGTRAREVGSQSGPNYAETMALIKNWQRAKAACLGQKHDTSLLKGACSRDICREWEQRSQVAKGKGIHWQFDLKKVDLQRIDRAGSKVVAVAKLHEVGRLCESRTNRLIERYSAPYEVTYTFTKEAGTYKITSIKLN